MKTLPITNASGELSITSVLGLTGRGSEEWALLRSYQYAQLAMVSRTRILAQAVAAMVVVLLFAPMTGFGHLLGWLGALCGSLTYSVRKDHALSQTDTRKIAQEEFKRQAWGTFINAMVWAAPIFLFGREAPIHLRFELWTVLAMLMTISAVIVPTVPLATLLFSSVVGGSSILCFVLMGQPGMAGVAALFVGCIAMGSIEASRHFLVSRLASASMAEKSEVVSLLLREFDQEDADWLWQIDSQRRLREVSPRFAEALGCLPKDIEGESLLKLLAEQTQSGMLDDAGLQALAQRLRERESFSNLLLRVMVGTERRYWSLSGAPRLDDAGGFIGFRGVASDVTAQQESSEKNAYLARYDALTGLPNRLMVTDALASAIDEAGRSGKPCAFLMIDLDRFKAVNDTLGHPVGDQLLAQVAGRLKVLMTANSICGRLGGDEFCVVVRDASDRSLVPGMGQAIIDDLSAPYVVDGYTLSIGASVGSAFGPREGEKVGDLMRNADFALYRAKRGGRGRHSAYDEALQAETESRVSLEAALRHAVERREFTLDYQPVVDARNERVVCFEALLRWNSPTHGLMMPDQFLPLADETRLILPIGEWVLGEACAQAVQWPGGVRVAVNVSDRQVLDPGFVDSVVKALAVSGLAPQRLEIEVREGLFQADAATARATLERLTALGCGVTLDDFGAGHASISYLCEMHFAAIKLDRALIRGAAHDNAESIAMIRAAVALADSLEMVTIAKGVESEAELAAAFDLSCGRMQGRIYGAPMPLDDVRGMFGGADRAVV